MDAPISSDTSRDLSKGWFLNGFRQKSRAATRLHVTGHVSDLLRVLTAARYSEPREASIERHPRDPERLGGADEVPAALLERGEERLPLRFIHRIAERRALSRLGVEHGRRGGARACVASRAGPQAGAYGRGIVLRLHGARRSFVEGDVFGKDLLVRARRGRAQDDVAQLPDVSRPAVRPERGERRRGQREPVASHGLFGLFQEGQGKELDVFDTLAQRRDRNGKDIQPVVEVAAETPLADLLVERLVRCGHDPDVHLSRRAAAQTHDFLLLQDAQERRLRRRRELAHLVEEQGASVGILEPPGVPLAPASRESAGLVAEELRLHQLRGDRAAVDDDEGPAAAQAARVDGVGEELLAGAGFAAQHHGQRIARRGPRQVDRFAQRRGGSEDAPEIVAGRMGSGALLRARILPQRRDANDPAHHHVVVQHRAHRRAPRFRERDGNFRRSRALAGREHPEEILARRTGKLALLDERASLRRFVLGDDAAARIHRDERVAGAASRPEGMSHDFRAHHGRRPHPLLHCASDGLDDHERAPPLHLPGSGEVDHPDRQRIAWREDRSRGARPGLPCRDVMLGGEDLDGTALRERGSGAVRPRGVLGPARAGAEVDLRDALDRLRVPVDREHPSFGVERRKDVIGEAEPGGEVFQDGAREAKEFAPPLPLVELVFLQNTRNVLQRRIDAVRIADPAPRPGDLLGEAGRLDAFLEPGLPEGVDGAPALENRGPRRRARRPGTGSEHVAPKKLRIAALAGHDHGYPFRELLTKLFRSGRNDCKIKPSKSMRVRSFANAAPRRARIAANSRAGSFLAQNRRTKCTVRPPSCGTADRREDFRHAAPPEGICKRRGGRKSMKQPYEIRMGMGAAGERRIAHACEDVEERMVAWMAAHGISFLRVSLGIVFLWFGGLKFLPGLSPAEGLAGATITKLTFGLVEAKVAVAILAVWETGIGLALVFGVQLRLALGLLFLQMAGTLTPLLLFPAETFTRFPFAPTMEGQYILKNMVLISGAIVVGATLHGGTLIAKPLRE